MVAAGSARIMKRNLDNLLNIEGPTVIFNFDVLMDKETLSVFERASFCFFSKGRAARDLVSSLPSPRRCAETSRKPNDFCSAKNRFSFVSDLLALARERHLFAT
jgi:hypothetical protein